MKKLTDCELLR